FFLGILASLLSTPVVGLGLAASGRRRFLWLTLLAPGLPFTLLSGFILWQGGLLSAVIELLSAMLLVVLFVLVNLLVVRMCGYRLVIQGIVVGPSATPTLVSAAPFGAIGPVAVS